VDARTSEARARNLRGQQMLSPNHLPWSKRGHQLSSQWRSSVESAPRWTIQSRQFLPLEPFGPEAGPSRTRSKQTACLNHARFETLTTCGG